MAVGILDWFEVDEDFASVETVVPKDMGGSVSRELALRSRYEVTVVCIKPPGQGFTHATPETVLSQDALLNVAGPTKKAEDFAHLS